MQRDMSYDLDATFSQRGAGELQKEEVVRSRVIRSPGLQVVSQAAMYKPLDHGRPYSTLRHGIGTNAGDMAGFLDNEISIFGKQVTVKSLAIGGAIAAAAWYFLIRKQR